MLVITKTGENSILKGRVHLLLCPLLAAAMIGRTPALSLMLIRVGHLKMFQKLVAWLDSRGNLSVFHDVIMQDMFQAVQSSCVNTMPGSQYDALFQNGLKWMVEQIGTQRATCIASQVFATWSLMFADKNKLYREFARSLQVAEDADRFLEVNFSCNVQSSPALSVNFLQGLYTCVVPWMGIKPMTFCTRPAELPGQLNR